MKAKLSLLLLLSCAAPLAIAAAPPAEVLEGSQEQAGLVPVHVNRSTGKIYLELPRPDSDGFAGRYIYVTALETGLGSASIGLDRAVASDSRLLVFRRLGNRVLVEVENPRFRATGASEVEQRGVTEAFATSTLWTGEVAAERPNGNILVEISGFITRDDMNLAQRLREQEGGDYRLVPELSVADPNSVRALPNNIEMEGRLTFVSQRPGPEVGNIAPVPGNVTFTLRHSLVRLPEAGYQMRRFDPRAGSFGTQVVDFSQPLDRSVVTELANRFRLDKVDPSATRSRVRRPILFYVDRAAPEPIRSALMDGVGWWREAFDRAGFIDAFQVELLPDGVDPLDTRYNVLNWVNRATRGWSYGQAITDPRTGEIIAGRVLLGSLRVRQDMMIYQALVGAGLTGTGDANDPVTAALARIRQLAAHEVGHAIGIAHNFAASSQGRYSVMDYPAPRIGLVDGRLDLRDSYGVGLGRWDDFAVQWLYGAHTDADAQPVMAAGLAEGLRYIGDDDARPPSAGHPEGSLWDDFADPVGELERMMQVRAAAVSRFGPAAIGRGTAVADLRRAFVPVWLIHRYQLEAAAKQIGGVYFSYAVNGDGREAARPVQPAEQRRAIAALLATLRPDASRVPAAILPALSAGWSGSSDRQTDIEIMRTAGGPVFDPLVATETSAALTLANLLQPHRLNRLELHNQADPQSPGAHQLVDMLIAQVFDFGRLGPADAAVQRRVATTSLLALARVQRDPALSPTIALALSERIARLGRTLASVRGDDPHGDWSRGLARLIADREALERAAADPQRLPRIPPGMPIG
ncbi:MAG: hypothetical protein JWL74_1263 [Alphaproteobacteria bacterium]|nr:hypothetical protein [Alphaproteobacteria bacterium]